MIINVVCDCDLSKDRIYVSDAGIDSECANMCAKCKIECLNDESMNDESMNDESMNDEHADNE